MRLRSIKKRGDEKYYIIISLILGLMVLAISLYWIFQEYFNQDEINWETCRQSILLRNTLPEADIASSKGFFDLRCKTEVVEIDTTNKTEAEEQVAKAISQSWYLVGKGDFLVFPGDGWALWGVQDSPCLIFARITLSDKTKQGLGSNLIDLQEALNLKMDDVSYWEYLNPSDGKKAFNYFKAWDKNGFSIKYIDASFDDALKDSAKTFNYPRYFDPNKGDLFVIYSENVVMVTGNKRSLKPFIVLVQQKDFDKLDSLWLGHTNTLKAKVCTSYDSIPA